MAKPQGIRRISPGAIVTDPVTAARRSAPAACSVAKAGKARSWPPGSRLIFIVIGRGTVGSPAKGGVRAGPREEYRPVGWERDSGGGWVGRGAICAIQRAKPQAAKTTGKP